MELSLGTQESSIPFAGTHGCFSTKIPTRNHPKDPLIHFDLVQWIVAETQPRRCWALDLIQSSDSAFLYSCNRRNSNRGQSEFGLCVSELLHPTQQLQPTQQQWGKSIFPIFKSSCIQFAHTGPDEPFAKTPCGLSSENPPRVEHWKSAQ